MTNKGTPTHQNASQHCLGLKEIWITKTPQTRLYHLKVPIIGLTGGIATGKSTVAKLFIKKNIPVIDADQLVKKIYMTDEAKNFIQHEFPDAIVSSSESAKNGTPNIEIDFKKLRSLAFNTIEVKNKLEQFIYSLLPEAFQKAYHELPPHQFIVYDVPLLFEKELDKLVDISICVYSSREVQKNRLKARDHISGDLVEKILSQQMDIEEKKAKSQLVLDNQSTLEELELNFNKLLEKLSS